MYSYFLRLYEVFSLVSFEAAAAGLPLIVSSVYGVEEFLQDGINGFEIKRTVEGVVQGIERFLILSAETRRGLGVRARHDVQRFGSAAFAMAWRSFYASIESQKEQEQEEAACRQLPWKRERNTSIAEDHARPHKS